MSEKDSRGNKRDPAPRVLFGHPAWFDHLARGSRSPHPHLHSVLSYRNEPARPSRDVKDRIMGLYLRLLRGGLAANKIYCLGVDHGDHDHLAVYRHLVVRGWPRFQPYYHESDWLLFSDFQWLVNRRHGFLAPEDPANAQLISIAGAHFDEEQLEFVAELRQEIAILRSSGKLTQPGEFLEYLRKEKGCTIEVIRVSGEDGLPDGDKDNDTRASRVWIKVSTQSRSRPDTALVVPLKGPLCSLSLEKCEEAQQKRSKYYENFQGDASMIWSRFLDGIRKRRGLNKEKYPQFFEAGEPGEVLGFDDLEPSCHVKEPWAGVPGIH